MRKLLKIATSVRERVSLEERRDPVADPDVIQLDAPVEQPVVDDGVGSTAPSAIPENAELPAPEVSPEAPAAVEEPVVEPETDPVTTPEADPVPPAAVAETPADEVGGADLPAVEPVPPSEAATDPAATPEDGAATDPTPQPTDEPTPDPMPTDAAPVADPDLPPDATDSVPDAPLATDDVPVTGEAPVAPTEEPGADSVPEAAPVGEPAAPVTEPEPVAPADATTDPVAEPGASEPAPTTDGEKVTDEMTSAWVDGVSVDAEEVKQHLEDAAAEVMDADNTTDELEEAAVALENLREIIQEGLATENPAVSDTTVNLVHIEAEKALEHVGEVLTIKSIESTQSPLERLQLTMEAIGEKLEEIWEAIKVAVKRAWEAWVKFFNGLIDSAQNVKNNIEKMRKALKALKGGEEQVGADAIKGSLAAHVGFDGLKNIQDLLSAFTKLDSGMSPFLENSKAVVHKAILNAGNEVIEAVQSKDDSETKERSVGITFGKIITDYSSLGTKLVKMVSDKATTDTDSEFNITGVVTTTSGMLPGGYVLEASDFARKEGMFTIDHFTTLARGRFIRIDRESVKAEAAPVANEAEMLKLLDVLESLIDSVIKSKSDVSQFNRDIDAFNRQAQKAITDASHDDDRRLNDITTYLRAIANIGPSLVRQNTTLMNLVVTISNNALKYVTACAKLYPSYGGEAIEGSVEKGTSGTGLAVA